MCDASVGWPALNSIILNFCNAAFAIAGMVKFEDTHEIEKKPLIGATMFGVTTPCLTEAQKYLEDRGYEVLIFHATGTGGQSMEALIDGGFIEGVLDLTTTEWRTSWSGYAGGWEHRLRPLAGLGSPR